MAGQKAIFIDKTGTIEAAPELWEPAIIKGADFEVVVSPDDWQVPQ